MTELREQMVAELADRIVAITLDHPTRVGLDGRSTAGKSSLADELAIEISNRGRSVVRVSIDDFHFPGHKFRSQRGGWTPELYYAEGFDYAAFRDLVLLPISPGGNRQICGAIFNSLLDEAIPENWQTVDADAVVVIDGAFLRRPEFADLWDLMFWIEIDYETMIARARKRDVAWVGDEEVVAERYRRHWVPTHDLYERLESPRERADIIIDNRDLANPLLTIRTHPS